MEASVRSGGATQIMANLAASITTRAKEAYERKDFLLALDLYEKAGETAEPSLALSLSLCACFAVLQRWEGALSAAEQVKPVHPAEQPGHAILSTTTDNHLCWSRQ